MRQIAKNKRKEKELKIGVYNASPTRPGVLVNDVDDDDVATADEQLPVNIKHLQPRR